MEVSETDVPRTRSHQQSDRETICYRIATCAIGPVAIASAGQGICAILFGEDAEALESDLIARFPTANLQADDGNLVELAARVTRFLDHPQDKPDFPVAPRGTDFQVRVWHALREIGPGSTASYKEVAVRIGAPGAVRAVARACAANPVAVAIPCHRVVRSDGSLSGYRWGAARKRALLEREAQT